MPVILSKAVGIDLGTTNSAVGLLNPADADIILHRDAHRRETTPSCVWRNPATGELLVGHKAFARWGALPSPIRSFKTLMGQDVRLDLEGGCLLSPEELSAEVLKEMKRQIEEDARMLSTSETTWLVNRAIVTVPAYFDQHQVGATQRAAALAGLELLELLHEPTAAATYHCWRTGVRDGAFMVFDLGGGTFDVTILRVTAGKFSLHGLSGHTQLGGDNLDTAIAEGMLERLKAEGYALELDLKDPEDKLRFDLLKYLAEGVKKKLSDEKEYTLRDTSTLQDKHGRQVIFNTLYERTELVKWMQPVIERTITYCWEALQKAEKSAGLKLAEIDQIILAGGSTHIPAVQERVRREFCPLTPEEWELYRRECMHSDRPVSPLEGRAKCQKPVYDKVDTIVALGAAIHGATFGGLHLTDDEGSMRVEARGVSVSSRTVMQVGGRVKSLKGASLKGGSICLYVAEPHYEETVKLGTEGQFFFEGVPMTPEGEVILNFEILGEDNQCLAVMKRCIKPGSEPPIPPSPVLPKAISMDVESDGVTERKELIPAGTSLPTTGKFMLRHPGFTNQIRFALYQRQRLIKEVLVPVPSSLPKGTAIDLALQVDGFSFITMKGKVGDVPFDAAIEPPQPRELPTAAALDALGQSFREGLAYLDSGPRMAKEARYKQTLKAYQGALARNERHQAIHEFEELEDVVASVARVTIVLEPEKSKFDKRVAKVSRLVQFGRETMQQQGKDAAEAADWESRVEAQRAVGEKAYHEGSRKAQKDLTDAYQQLADLERYIIPILRGLLPPSPPPTDAERAQWALERCREELDEVESSAQSHQRHDLAAKVRTLRDEVGSAEQLATTDPHAANSQLATIERQIKDLASQLSLTLRASRDPEHQGRNPLD